MRPRHQDVGNGADFQPVEQGACVRIAGVPAPEACIASLRDLPFRHAKRQRAHFAEQQDLVEDQPVLGRDAAKVDLLQAG